MGEITRQLDENNQPTPRYQGALTSIARKLVKGNGLIFLGAGCGVDKGPALPTASALSKEMAGKCRLDWHESIPLSTVAFYYESFFKRDLLNEFLVQRIGDTKIPPSTTIQRLVEIIALVESPTNIMFVISTNYDQQLETAYKSRFGKDPYVVIYNGGIDLTDDKTPRHNGLPSRSRFNWVLPSQTILYKMHGCISNATGRNLVVTEEDYVNFLSNALSHHENKRLWPSAIDLIGESSILFVGYSLTDWNFRVIYKATAEGRLRDSYAVQRFVADPAKKGADEERWEATVEFWSRKNIDILNVDASEFMGDLLNAVQAEIAPVPVVG